MAWERSVCPFLMFTNPSVLWAARYIIAPHYSDQYETILVKYIFASEFTQSARLRKWGPIFT